jgi:hypothetical protein
MINGKFLTQPAVFFELDNVIRRLKPGIAGLYVEKFGAVPPAPVDLGEQEVIPEVARFIATRCLETGAKPIGLDMAPYLGHTHDGKPIVPMEAYKQILGELKHLLADFGVRDAKFLYCPHPAREVPQYGKAGEILNHELHPLCNCRFPNHGLLYQACKVHEITHFDDKGEFAILKPSCMIGNSVEAREVSIVGSSMEFFWVEGILNGSVHYEGMITHAHLNAARALQKEAPRVLDTINRGRIVEGLPEVHDLPEQLQIPSKVAGPRIKVVDDINADG